MTTLKAIDAHAGGQTLRLLVEGCPPLRGRTMLEKRDAMSRQADWIRRVAMLEPRGHADLCGALLTEPVTPGSHAGVLGMHLAGYTTAGSGIAALTTIALERGLVVPGGDGQSVVFDTIAGVVRASVRLSGSRVESVTVVNVPAFVFQAGMPLKVGSRALRVDVAFAGAFYAIVDSESAGVGVAPAFLPELRRTGLQIKREIERLQTIAHPTEPKIAGIEGIIFTAPPEQEGADLRSATVFGNGAVDRSPGESSTSAILAVLSAMGLVDRGTPFVHESITGARFTGRVREQTTVASYDATLTEVEASAWIIAEHTLFADESDGLHDGFALDLIPSL